MALSPAKILVVDDEPEMLALLNEWLGEDGHDVETATNGRDAFEIFLNQKPVLTITDLPRPGMDGFQLISRIRGISDALVIALTARGGDEHTLRGFDMGADEYLVKPASKRVFLARVKSLLRRASSAADISVGYRDEILTLDFLSCEAQVKWGNPSSAAHRIQTLGVLGSKPQPAVAPSGTAGPGLEGTAGLA